MAHNKTSPFARVSDGYDPNEVAAFAAEALTWKRDLAKANKEVARYSALIGEIDEIEREAAALIDDATQQATKTIEDAHLQAAIIIENAEAEAARTVADAQTETPVLTVEPSIDFTPIVPVEESLENESPAFAPVETQQSDAAPVVDTPDSDLPTASDPNASWWDTDANNNDDADVSETPDNTWTGWDNPVEPDTSEDAVSVFAENDPIEAIFQAVDEDDSIVDQETLREQKIAQAAANLWKRRGTLTPQD